MALQTTYVPKHAIPVIAHFFRLEKLIGFRWSPSSNSIYNTNGDRFGDSDRGGKYTNIDMFLVLEWFFYCTDRTITTTGMEIQITELLVMVWIQLIFGEESRKARYLFRVLRMLLGLGAVHNRMAKTQRRNLLYIGNQWVCRQEERKTA